MREATKADLPKGHREAQCPICWRLFSSDPSCEEHKPWRRPVTATCKEPPSLRHRAFERRGLAVWYREGTAPRSWPGREGTGDTTVSRSGVLPDLDGGVVS